jgi:hypothetical protein
LLLAKLLNKPVGNRSGCQKGETGRKGQDGAIRSRQCVLHCSRLVSRTEKDGTLTGAKRDRRSSRQCSALQQDRDRRYTDCAAEKGRRNWRQCVLHCSRLVSRTEKYGTLTGADSETPHNPYKWKPLLAAPSDPIRLNPIFNDKFKYK